MEEILKIGCPVCGSILTVKNQSGIESRSVTCPVCKKRSPFVSFKRINDTEDDEPTQYPHMEDDKQEGENYTIGRLIADSVPYQLQPGKNIIGRKAEGSGAHVQIPCTSKRMSREHLVIEIKKVPGKGSVHYVSLNKAQVNPTYIGSMQLEYGDKLILKHNDIIRLPDMEVRFEIPDEEGTEL